MQNHLNYLHNYYVTDSLLRFEKYLENPVSILIKIILTNVWDAEQYIKVAETSTN